MLSNNHMASTDKEQGIQEDSVVKQNEKLRKLVKEAEYIEFENR